MRVPPLNSASLPSALPAEAYARDLERLGRTGALGPADDTWLMFAHALSRFSGVPASVVTDAAPTVADQIAVSAFANGLGGESPILRAARGLRRLSDHEAQPAEGEDPAVAEVARATQAVAEEMELAGAFELAYATLVGVLSAFSAQLSPRLQGNILAQLGRAARQLAAFDVARAMYEEALRIGHEYDAMDVVARAQLGLGSLAVILGNYPNAREQYDCALLSAESASEPDLIRNAHHGLLYCGITSGDLDSAMVHGWNVLRLCIAPDPRAEALMNMAEICRLSGEHDAAIRTYKVAMEWTSRARVRLHAIAGALQSAVSLRRFAEARHYLALLDEQLPAMPDTHTRASLGVDMAAALHDLGETTTALARLTEARALASENSYHEVVHRAEQAAAAWHLAPDLVTVHSATPRRKRRQRSEPFREVLRSLNGLLAASSRSVR
jgi:tetratricopeptide (TPR) repeat protein